ncbi:hypothetical protein [Shewanella sp.]|uniref:hypothetical protein n=1 Tax=Shewanella sp. TaxID=50422 RepID=UPI003A97A495
MLEPIYYANVILSFLLFFANYDYVRKKWHLKIINPLLLLLAVYLPTVFAPIYLGPLVLIENGFLNDHYQFAVLVTNVSLVFSLLSSVFFFRFILKIKGVELFFLRVYSYSPRKSSIRWAEFFFLSLSLLLFVAMAQSGFGLLNWLVSPRTGYQYHRDGVGSLFALSLTFLSVAYCLAFLGRRSIGSFIIKSLLYLTVVYFWGSKGFIISFGMFFILCLYFAKYRHLKTTILFSLPAIFGLVVYNLYTALGSVSYIDVLSYFDHYRNSGMYYEAYQDGRIGLFYGEIMMSDFWSLIPRAIYPDKPYVYGIYIINEILFPGMTEIGQTPAFGGPVKYFADFGFFSVIIFAFFNISYWVKLYLLNFYFRGSELGVDFSRNILFVLIFCICFAPAFLSYIPGSLGFLLVLIIWIFLGFVSRLKISENV